MKVSISYGDLKADFEGAPSDVYINVVKFLEKAVPAFSLATKIRATAGVDEILEKSKDFFGYDSAQGIYIRADLSKLPTSTAVLLFGAARHLNKLFGHAESSEFQSSEVADVLGRPEKTVSGRLTELVKKGYLKRLGRGGYLITPAGLDYLVESSAVV